MPLVVLFFATVASLIFYFVRSEMYSDWETTTGMITSVEIKGVKLNKTIMYYYSYCIDGKEYSGRDSFSSSKPNLYNEGQQTEIWYNLDNPAESRFAKPGPQLYVYIPFVFAMPIMLVVYNFYSRIENKTRRLR